VRHGGRELLGLVGVKSVKFADIGRTDTNFEELEPYLHRPGFQNAKFEHRKCG